MIVILEDEKMKKRKVVEYTGPHAAEHGSGIIAEDLLSGDLLGSDTGVDWWVAEFAIKPEEGEDYGRWSADQTGCATINGDPLSHSDFQGWGEFLEIPENKRIANVIETLTSVHDVPDVSIAWDDIPDSKDEARTNHIELIKDGFCFSHEDLEDIESLSVVAYDCFENVIWAYSIGPSDWEEK